jgi:hypothetical protein
MDCKHDVTMLVGMADGIHCKGCGKVFHSLDEIRPKEGKDEAGVATRKSTGAGKKRKRD